VSGGCRLCQSFHLCIDVAGCFPRAAPAHGVEGYGFIRLLVDRVAGLRGWGWAGSWCGACVDFGGQLRLGRDWRLGPGQLVRLGEVRR
jgi:hypothetical protein